MNMKMNKINDFQKFYNQIKNNEMPIKTAFKLNKLFNQIDKEALFYQDEFNKIIQKYAKRDDNNNYVYTEDGNSILIIDGKQAECNEKLAELYNLEVDVSLEECQFDLTHRCVDVRLRQAAFALESLEDSLQFVR